jgi:hypothetical protein
MAARLISAAATSVSADSYLLLIGKLLGTPMKRAFHQTQQEEHIQRQMAVSPPSV